MNELAKALAQAQAEMKAAQLDATNPFFKSKYATLASVIEAIKPLAKNGISFTQGTVTREHGDVFLITKLLHGSGDFVEFETPILCAKKDMQTFGSALTYARRYGLSAIAGISSDEDDDGNQTKVQDRPPEKTVNKTQKVSTSQLTRLWAITNQHKWKKEDIESFIKNRWKISSTKDLTQESYNNVCGTVAKMSFESAKALLIKEGYLKIPNLAPGGDNGKN